VNADVRVRALGSGTRASFGERVPYPSELQSAASTAEITAALADAEVLLSSWAGALPALDLPALAPRLRWVQLLHAGAERVDRSLVGDVAFTTVGSMSAGPIAEWVLAAMLLFAKGWPQAWRNQRAHEYRRYMPRELAGCTVGMVGLGTIGMEVAHRVRAMGCRVIGMRRSVSARSTHDAVDEVVPPHDLHYLLGASDFVVVAAPLTSETRGLIGAAALAAMRAGGVLINVARGALVDADALVDALRAERIAGAALDVFQEEPLPASSPLWDLENLVLTPHVAAGTDSYYERATEVFCDNLRRYLRGEPLANAVDVSRGY
jgi:phosphoglycerate dehydrogenase-like enzyme